MPHMIDETTGRPAFVFNKQNGDPWHGLGTPVDGAMTAEDVFDLCPALDFTVAKAPVRFDPGQGAGTRPFPGYETVYRTDTMAPLGMVKSTYSLFQNREITDFADAVRGSSDAAYDTAGSLYEGRLVFVQLMLGDDFRIPGDPSTWERRLLVYAGHDGRHALKGKRTQTRVVCANTHNEAIKGAGSEYSVKHTSNMNVAVQNAQAALRMVARYDEAFELAMKALTKVPLVSVDDIKAFTTKLIPVNPQVERPARSDAARDAIAALFLNSPTLDGVDKTGYRMYQAVGEYADHYRTYRARGATAADARAVAVIEGSASDLKSRALSLLVPNLSTADLN